MCSTLLRGFVHGRFLIFGQLFQCFLRCGKSGFLLMKLLQQLLLTRFVIFLDPGCIHVLTFFYIIYIMCVSSVETCFSTIYSNSTF